MLAMWVAIAILVFHTCLVPNALSFSAFNASQYLDQPHQAQQRWGRYTIGPVVYATVEIILSLLTFGIGLVGGYWGLSWPLAAALSLALVVVWLLFWFIARPLSVRKPMLSKPRC
jgi:hypothetical protein